MHIISYP